MSFSRPKLSSLQSLLSSPAFVREALCDRYLNRFETALYDQTNWRDYAEESNWINWFLAIELIRNVKHSYHSSSWMYKVNKTSSKLPLIQRRMCPKVLNHQTNLVSGLTVLLLEKSSCEWVKKLLMSEVGKGSLVQSRILKHD